MDDFFNRHMVSWGNIAPNQFGAKLSPYIKPQGNACVHQF